VKCICTGCKMSCNFTLNCGSGIKKIEDCKVFHAIADSNGIK
jgi:hypothetical protein